MVTAASYPLKICCKPIAVRWGRHKETALLCRKVRDKVIE